MIKNNKGITLIALVITIIVLLILAGVATATLTGENGVLTRAKTAGEKNQEAYEDEKNKLSSYEEQIDNYNSNARGTITDEELTKRINDAVAASRTPTILYTNSSAQSKGTTFNILDYSSYSYLIVYAGVDLGEGGITSRVIKVSDIDSPTKSFFIGEYATSSNHTCMFLTFLNTTTVKIIDITASGWAPIITRIEGIK